MAEVQGSGVKAKKARRAARKAVPKPEKKGSKTAGSAGVPDKERESEGAQGQSIAAAEPEKRKRGNGLKRLQKAADRRLACASEELADLLLEKAKEGKLESAKLLVTLAERKKERKPEEKKKKKKREGPSWAELLASEPEYVEEKPEIGDVWVGDGWKNQKTGEIVRG